MEKFCDLHLELFQDDGGVLCKGQVHFDGYVQDKVPVLFNVCRALEIEGDELLYFLTPAVMLELERGNKEGNNDRTE